jgi:hypothetical protein
VIICLETKQVLRKTNTHCSSLVQEKIEGINLSASKCELIEFQPICAGDSLHFSPIRRLALMGIQLYIRNILTSSWETKLNLQTGESKGGMHRLDMFDEESSDSKVLTMAAHGYKLNSDTSSPQLQ